MRLASPRITPWMATSELRFMSMLVFFRKNGVRFAPDQAQATAMMLALAAGEVSEESRALALRQLAQGVNKGVNKGVNTRPPRICPSALGNLKSPFDVRVGHKVVHQVIHQVVLGPQGC
jgi:hypothetical protein